MLRMDLDLGRAAVFFWRLGASICVSQDAQMTGNITEPVSGSIHWRGD